jgi:hypothetical protein
MADDAQVKRVAADHLRWRGAQSIDWLLEQAEIADSIGDAEAAKVWREIAEAVERLLRSRVPE